MAVIAIDINDVLRDFISQFEYTYNKYIPDFEVNILENPLKSFNLIEYFPFTDEVALNKFLYQEASLEIFGHADESENNIMTSLNKFISDMEDFYDHEVILISREVMSAIPATHFFLSKTGCKCGNIRFVKTYADQWKHCDILVTANPTVLATKPESKVSVKVSRSYNEDDKADHTIKSLFDFMTCDDTRETITTTKLLVQ